MTKSYMYILIIFLAVAAGFFGIYYIWKYNSPGAIGSSADNPQSGTAAIGKAFPEFEDFENKQFVAGQEIKIVNNYKAKYYAYIVYGSGIPIVKATCFMVDKTGQVSKIGELPKAGEFMGQYRDVDPITCQGIK